MSLFRFRCTAHRRLRPSRRAWLHSGGLGAAVLALWLGAAAPGWAYSLLTHEEIVDILWQDHIRVLLLKRYPAATTAQLREAHAYAYGGCLVQDMGYYPFGKEFFSDLTHYVRTGDFVANLLREAANLDQYAFALGALAHYCSDNSGHPLINQAVGLEFPKLRAKYGESVTYEECPRAHIRTEFGFDMTQVAKQRYTSDRYHDFIGFEVSRPLLERAVYETYGLPLEVVLGDVDLSIGTFRHAVSQVIPEMTRAALTVYHPERVRDPPTFDKAAFLYNLSRAQYEKEWGTHYRKPGLLARFFGFLVRWLPKVGPMQALAFRMPTAKAEQLYLQSVNLTVACYERLLRQIEQGDLRLPNMDCDTGEPTCRGEYLLADKTHAQLLEELCKRGLNSVQPELRRDLLAYYASPGRRHPTHKELRAWFRTQRELEALREGPASLQARVIRKELLTPPQRLETPKSASLR